MNTPFSNDNFAEDYENLDFNSQEFLNLEFDECTFTKCHFGSSSFKNCKFMGCRFHNCDLSLIKVLNSKFSDMTFTDCKIIGVDWSRACWDSLILKPLKFETSVLNSSSFYGLNLEGLILRECEAKDVDFREANLCWGIFVYADFQDSLFFNTNLSKANFSHAKGFDIDVKTNILEGAVFSRNEAVRLLEGLGIELSD
jgi:uncharacterized protein YjbI with pentapeptide repeats